MFCSNCGKEMQDGTKFCENCGAPVEQQEAPAQQQEAPAQQQEAPAQPSQASTMFNDFIALVKSVFSKDLVKNVGAQASNSGNGWIVSLAVNILVYCLAFMFNILQYATWMIKETTGISVSASKMDYDYMGSFGYGLLIAGAVTAAMIVGVRMMMCRVSKQNVAWNNVLNLVSTAILPLSACYVVNILAGVIWFPLVLIISVVGLFMTVTLIYATAQKLAKPQSSPFIPYTLVIAAVTAVAFLVVYLIIDNAVGSVGLNMGSFF